MKNKVIYLKSLMKTFKPKTETFPKDIIKHLDELGIDLINGKKPVDLHTDKKAGRNFILKHTEEFLHHAIDFSMDDKIKGLWASKNNNLE